MFTRQLVLAFPNTSKPFTLMMDVLLTASGAVLMQLNTNGDMQPCGYLFQTFFPTEQNYDIFNWELLAVIHGLEEWRQYLLGFSFPWRFLQTTRTSLTSRNHKSYPEDKASGFSSSKISM